MAISKIMYKSSEFATPEVWMDVTSATATASDIIAPKTAMLADGVVTTGTGSGGGSVEIPIVPEKWVNFIDYNGDILYSYTKSEIAQLQELPANPTHAGLTSQGWNWTLNEIQSEVANGISKIWVGQSYITTSGATEIDVEFTNPDYLSPYLAINYNNNPMDMTIDWGDNSTPDSFTTSSAGLGYHQHTFPSCGRYTIKISTSSTNRWYGFYNSRGNNCASILLIGAEMSYSTANMRYANAIKAIRCGEYFFISGYGTFRSLNNLEYVTIPNTILNVSNSSYTIGGSTFAQCSSLKSVTLPRGVVVNTSRVSTFDNCSELKNASIPYSMGTNQEQFYYNCKNLTYPYIPSSLTEFKRNYLYYCMSVQDLVLPAGLTTIGQAALSTLPSLAELTIPATVTSIGNDGLRYNYGILAYHFLPTTPPTLGTNVFGGINANCKIYVPAASVNDYKTASGWSSYASYIEAEPT